MDDRATGFIGDPAAIAGSSRQSAIEAHRPLGDGPWKLVKLAFEVGREEELGFGFGDRGGDIKTGSTEGLDATSGHFGEWVLGRDDDTFGPKLEEEIGARGCFAVMAAGFEGDVEGCFADLFGEESLEGFDFGVGATEAGVIAFPDAGLVEDDEAADHGVGFDASLAEFGKFDGLPHPKFIVGRVHEAWKFAGGVLEIGRVGVEDQWFGTVGKTARWFGMRA